MVTYSYTAKARLRMRPSVLAKARFSASSSLKINWSFEDCTKRWLRVEGTCFRPPPVLTDRGVCPPYPTGKRQEECTRYDLDFTNLFGTGQTDAKDPLSDCAEDGHYLVWVLTGDSPSYTQLPFVVPATSLPSYADAEDGHSRWLGISCDGVTDSSVQYRFRTSFAMPENVDPETLEILVEVSVLNALHSVWINEQPTGISLVPLAPIYAGTGIKDQRLLLRGEFADGENTIDFVVGNAGTDTPLPVALKVTIVSVRACVGIAGIKPGEVDTCVMTYYANMLACDAEEVCRQLKSINFIHPIKRIGVINDSLDVNCYEDITPSLQNCEECCDLLIDEEVEENVTATADVAEDFVGTCEARFSFRANARTRQRLRHGSGASLRVTPRSGVRVTYKFSAAARITLGVGADIAASQHEYQARASLRVLPAAQARSSRYALHAAARLRLRSATSCRLIIRAQTSGRRLNLRPHATGAMVFAKAMQARLRLYSRATSGISLLTSPPVAAALRLRPAARYASSHYNYQGRATLRLHSAARLHRDGGTMSASFRLTPASQSRVLYKAKMTARLTLASSTRVPLSTAWTGYADMRLTIRAAFAERCSDLGEIEMPIIAETGVQNEDVVFTETAAPPLSTEIGLVTDSGCCPSPVTMRLQLLHNLTAITPFAKFALRNGVTLPGDLSLDDQTFVPLLYGTRTKSWRGNLYYTGKAVQGVGSESWHFAFEFGCNGVSNLEPDVWRFSMVIRASRPRYDSTVRLIANFDSDAVCLDAVQFREFPFTVDPAGGASAPETRSPLIYHDEEGILSASQALRFVIQGAVVNQPRITFPQSLDRQLRATQGALL